MKMSYVHCLFLGCVFMCLNACAKPMDLGKVGHAVVNQTVSSKSVVTPDGQVETDPVRVAGNMVLLGKLPNNHRLYYIVKDANTRILTCWQLTNWFLGQPFGKIVHKTILMERVRDGWMLVDVLNPNSTSPTPVARPYIFRTERQAFLIGKSELSALP